MDSNGEENDTQQTQTAFDPRRDGQQNSGFSDDDLSDIICFLVPTSDHARLQLQQVTLNSSLHIVGRKDVEQVKLDYERDDDARNFTLPIALGEHAIVLRLSAEVKNPLAGFTFGRNRARCDIFLRDDPYRRLSNIHFRIYLNEFGVLMLEDSSTNGTVVDEKLLKSKCNNANSVRRTLTSGSTIKILMHKDSSDLCFMVRIPRREGEHEAAYRRNLVGYMDRLKSLANDAEATIIPGPEGRLDLFPQKNQQAEAGPAPKARPLADQTTRENAERLGGLPRPWNGSEKYHRIGEIGRELDKRKFMKDGVLDQKVENELNIMQRVMHPNIVRYIEHIDWDNRLFIIIMEYVPGGDLGKLVSELGHLPEEATQVMSGQLLDAVGYLHENNITHRDVKPDNILISSRVPFVVKLADFGLSKMIDNDETFLRTFCGTLLYCAPEVYSEYAEYDDNGRRHPRNRQRRQALGQRYDHAVDTWSLGGVLFYALTGRPPFPVKVGVSHQELLQLIMTTPLDISPLERAEVSEYGIDFLSRMLNRPSDDEVVDDILDDDTFRGHTGLNVDALEDKENLGTGPRHGENRLFGEIQGSAIGSSGAVPSGILNLPVSDSRHDSEVGSTSTVSEVRDSFDSDPSATPWGPSRKCPSGAGGLRTAAATDAEQMMFSASLANSDGSILQAANSKCRGNSRLGDHTGDVNTSKRKPSYDSSDEFDAPCLHKRPNFKRFRSEGLEDSVAGEVSDNEMVEFDLYAQLPSIKANSGRQIDHPVHKAAFWSSDDRSSWHLDYPEMTQLQLDAFEAAADARGEKFGPRSPLWELALKYFPAVHYRQAVNRKTLFLNGRAETGAEGAHGAMHMPDTQHPEDRGNVIVPVQTDPDKRIVATFESSPDSAVPDISVLVTESMVSWGRSLDNTSGNDGVFQDKKAASKMDEATTYLDKKMPYLLEHARRVEEATLDANQRKLTVETERQRSRDFEARRVEINRLLASRGAAARRQSHLLGMAPPTAHGRDDMTRRTSYIL
ncbi:hypothetical protein P8C59_007884 [Phyllachora maydis]|uniref:Autophagy-related protein 1 n=1 Tax=Phyllachora maydis TaxID=1825666 RepID=A0AAD9I9G4_9PEZI|nr:hypothetical protein P8C59_007884 [Phyllachora maydis]